MTVRVTISAKDIEEMDAAGLSAAIRPAAHRVVPLVTSPDVLPTNPGEPVGVTTDSAGDATWELYRSDEIHASYRPMTYVLSVGDLDVWRGELTADTTVWDLLTAGVIPQPSDPPGQRGWIASDTQPSVSQYVGWLDTSGAEPVLKVNDGTQFVTVGSGGSSGGLSQMVIPVFAYTNAATRPATLGDAGTFDYDTNRVVAENSGQITGAPAGVSIYDNVNVPNNEHKWFCTTLVGLDASRTGTATLTWGPWFELGAQLTPGEVTALIAVWWAGNPQIDTSQLPFTVEPWARGSGDVTWSALDGTLAAFTQQGSTDTVPDANLPTGRFLPAYTAADRLKIPQVNSAGDAVAWIDTPAGGGGSGQPTVWRMEFVEGDPNFGHGGKVFIRLRYLERYNTSGVLQSTVDLGNGYLGADGTRHVSQAQALDIKALLQTSTVDALMTLVSTLPSAASATQGLFYGLSTVSGTVESVHYRKEIATATSLRLSSTRLGSISGYQPNGFSAATGEGSPTVFGRDGSLSPSNNDAGILVLADTWILTGAQGGQYFTELVVLDDSPMDAAVTVQLLFRDWGSTGAFTTLNLTKDASFTTTDGHTVRRYASPNRQTDRHFRWGREYEVKFRNGTSPTDLDLNHGEVMEELAGTDYVDQKVLVLGTDLADLELRVRQNEQSRGVHVKDENNTVDAGARTLDFRGAGVTASDVPGDNNDVIITIPGAGGGTPLTTQIVQRKYGTPAVMGTVTENGTVPDTAHNLGAEPTGYDVWITCSTAEKGYAVGDRLWIGAQADRVACWGDATNYAVKLRGTPWVSDANTDSGSAITSNRWSMYIRPYLDETVDIAGLKGDPGSGGETRTVILDRTNYSPSSNNWTQATSGSPLANVSIPDSGELDFQGIGDGRAGSHRIPVDFLRAALPTAIAAGAARANGDPPPNSVALEFGNRRLYVARTTTWGLLLSAQNGDITPFALRIVHIT